MHDVQVRGNRRSDVPDDTLESIARYYRRVTTEARPMNRLVAGVMIATLGATGVQIAAESVPGWVAWSSFALAAAAILLALLRAVPNAVRLGRRTDAAEGQSELARSIWRDHLCCFGVIALLLTIQLTFARS